VLMNAVSAQAAGVKGLALASPAQLDNRGRPHESVLWAAALVGVEEVYAIGGAGAIAAFAYGVPAIGLEPVDVVTGPGNVYVAAAKRAVTGLVGIDSEAGTTEILIIADASADPEFVAADLLSQAEHDEAAASVLVTDSVELAERVRAAVERRATSTRHAARALEALSGPQSAVILVENLEDAAKVSNAYGPEHLEIQTAANDRVLSLIDDAGAIFVGGYSPVSLGDYLAGSNHVLPTARSARFASGLGVLDFVKRTSILSCGPDQLAALGPAAITLGEAEGLQAHARSVSIRLNRG